MTESDQKPKWRLQFSIKGILGATVLFAIASSFVLFYWNSRSEKLKARKQANELLVQCPSCQDVKYRPLDVVRTVNHLHSMGRKDSLAVLQAFSEKYPYDIDHYHQHQTLGLVIPLLFTRSNPEESTPYSFYDGTNGLIVVQDGIPFSIYSTQMFSLINQPDFSKLIDWANDSARFRNSPIVPADNPFDAAEALMLRLKSHKGDRTIDASHVRWQVYESVAHLFPNRRVSDLADAKEEKAKSDWLELKEECLRKGIYWNHESQSYSFRK